MNKSFFERSLFAILQYILYTEYDFFITSMKKKTLLIAGGAGFIGSNYTQMVVHQHPEYQIVVLDALTYAGNKANLLPVWDHIIFEHGNIANLSTVEKVFEKYHPAMVVNFAAETHVDRSILGPSIFLETNVRGTQNLLEVSRKYEVEKYLQVSTDEVYGDLGDTSGTYFEESTPLAPNCPYAASKASADLFVRSYFETYQLPALITRCTNNYGPYQYPEKLIPFFISRALQNQSLPIYGDGKNIRDWLYVQDHCRAIDMVLHQGKIGEVYNIGGHNEKTNLDITHIILDILKKPKSLITFVQDRKAHDRRYAMNPTKIENELGWKPEHSFEDWIGGTIQWYIDNPEWIVQSLENGKK